MSKEYIPYTPTTEEVCNHWVNVGFAGDEGSFDRWLESVKEESYQKGWDNALDASTFEGWK